MNALKNQCAAGTPQCVYINGAYACKIVPEPCFGATPVPVLSDIAMALVVLAVILVGYLALRGKL